MKTRSLSKLALAATARGWLPVVPDLARLVWRVGRDSRVPVGVRAGLVGVAAYVISPVDLIPNRLRWIGRLDDLLVATVGLRTVLRMVPQPVLLEHWTGEPDALERLLGRPLAAAPA